MAVELPCGSPSRCALTWILNRGNALLGTMNHPFPMMIWTMIWKTPVMHLHARFRCVLVLLRGVFNGANQWKL